MEQRIEVITPDKAESYLQVTHPNQRPINTGRVRMYANEMINGSWEIVPDSIAFDENGYLVNGRHRLEAVLKADATITAFVASGLPANSFPVMDQGQKRNAKQIVRANGQSPFHADALKVIAEMAIGGYDKNGHVRVTTSKLAEAADKYSYLTEFLPNDKLQGYTAVIKAVLILALDEGLSPAKVDRFCQVLRSWISESEEDYPIMAWVKYKNMKQKLEGLSVRRSDMYVAQRVVKALHNDEKVSVVTRNRKIFYRPNL
jgi:hypothetical protein